MIITRTPFRMSFFGGGTDFPEYFNEYGGAVLSSTFDKYCYVTVRHLPRFFDFKTHLTYSKMEYVNEYDEITHPAIREAMRLLDMHELRLTYDADLPAKSGLGTSSSFAVGMLNAFYALKGKYADKKRLADDSIYLERILCDESGGWQDQIAASYGGLNRIEFRDNQYFVTPVIIAPERKQQLNDNLLLFFTGFSRFSSDIQQSMKQNIDKRFKELQEIYALVDEAEKILKNKAQPLNEFGTLLNYTWKMKRKITNKISTSEIDNLYEKAIQAGAIGGKLLGAGGGGFLLFYVEKAKQKAVKEALEGLLCIPFKFENCGSSVVHYEAETFEMGV